MRGDNRTVMGGGDGMFHTTRWPRILGVQTQDEDGKSVLLGAIVEQYWKPAYCYLRRKGLDNEAAKDLTQGFFTEVVLGRHLVEKADPHRGRFRTFLLASLNNYVTSVGRADRAEKRAPPGKLVSLQGLDDADIPEPDPRLSPDAAFHHAWATAVLEDVLREIESQYRQAGKAVHWEVFRERVLGPILGQDEPPTLPELCAKHHIERPEQISSMIVTVKRKFRAVLRSRLRSSVESAADVDAEIHRLMQILSQSPPRSA